MRNVVHSLVRTFSANSESEFEPVANGVFAPSPSGKRIVLYDNLLKKHNTAEVESILAHEIGHWRHDHIAIAL